MKVVELSGGVGGARLARGLNLIESVDPTIVVNVGDDEDIHGLHVSPDIDTVLYTLAGIEGPDGWGRADETFTTNHEIGILGRDNTFRLGDRDLAMNIIRTDALRSGVPLSRFTGEVAKLMGIGATILPASDDKLRTTIETDQGETLSFQEYFVLRQQRDNVASVGFEGIAQPAPGVLEAINESDVLVIAPSNPPLSIWPILAVPGVQEAVTAHRNVIAVSPLFGGKALKGPADRVMGSLGLPRGNAGVLAAYENLLDRLVIDVVDAEEETTLAGSVSIQALDTRIATAEAAKRLCHEMLEI